MTEHTIPNIYFSTTWRFYTGVAPGCLLREGKMPRYHCASPEMLRQPWKSTSKFPQKGYCWRDSSDWNFNCVKVHFDTISRNFYLFDESFAYKKSAGFIRSMYCGNVVLHWRRWRSSKIRENGIVNWRGCVLPQVLVYCFAILSDFRRTPSTSATAGEQRSHSKHRSDEACRLLVGERLIKKVKMLTDCVKINFNTVGVLSSWAWLTADFTSKKKMN